METLYRWTYQSPVGPLTALVSERAVLRLEFGDQVTKHSPDVVPIASEEKTRACIRELEEYFAGRREQFTLPLDLRGTAFQRECWNALLQIPFGQTRTYAELARLVGRPQAFRAVGMANHDNPIAIIVPCHRVIASDGTLGGYGGGLTTKRWLLDLEQRKLAAQV